MSTHSLGTRSKASAIILGVLLLLFGLWTLWIAQQPIVRYVFLSVIGAWIFLISGVVSCVTYAASSKENRSALDLIFGIVLIIFGIIILCFPLRSEPFVVCFFGALVFLTGIADIIESMAFKKNGQSGWLLFLILGILTVLFGLSAIVVPIWFTNVTVLVIAFVLIFDGITEIIAGVRM